MSDQHERVLALHCYGAEASAASSCEWIPATRLRGDKIGENDVREIFHAYPQPERDPVRTDSL